MKKIKLLLIEDNRLLLDGMTSMIKHQPDLRIVAAGGNSEDVLPRAKKLQPDVLLLGLDSHDQNSLRSVEILKQHFPKSKLILMGALPSRGYLLRILKSGLSGLVLKDATFGEFLKTVRSVTNGATVLLPHGNLEFSDIRMTRREREVSELIAEGLSNKEIAQRLHIATYTVKSHVHNILQKLSLKTRLQILAYAHKHGISTPIQYNPTDAPFLTQKN